MMYDVAIIQKAFILDYMIREASFAAISLLVTEVLGVSEYGCAWVIVVVL